MLKKLFTSPSETELTPVGPPQNKLEDRARMEGRPAGEMAHTGAKAANASMAAAAAPIGKCSSFEQIYQTASVKPLRIPYSILKVAEMMKSAHLSTMSGEAKRCSLLMALEAAGCAVEEILQDAVIRQRALADYEDMQHDRLKHFESLKAEENERIQAELDRLTKLHQDRIQANLDEVAREQESFHSWQKAKQEEVHRMTEAVSYCAPQGGPVSLNTLAVVLDRVTPQPAPQPVALHTQLRNGSALLT
jgi:hypothetical protein